MKMQNVVDTSIIQTPMYLQTGTTEKVRCSHPHIIKIYDKAE